MKNQKVKVAYILTPIMFGGSEKVNLNFFKVVDRNRFDIHPILLVRPWEGESFFENELRNIGYAYDTVPVATTPQSGYFRVVRVAHTLYSNFNKSNYELVHTHGYFADICAVPVARILGVSTVSTCHGFISNDRKLRTYNGLDRTVLKICNRVIAVSEGIQTDLIKAGIKKSKISVIQNAVNSCFRKERLVSHRQEKRVACGIEPDQFVIGYVGRLSEEKGLLYLIEAASILKKKLADFRVMLLGEGPQRKDLERLVRIKALEKEVLFANFQHDIEAWLPTFDVFVLPSLTEGSPMALLEAMSMGVPVVATAVGGVPKIVQDGFNGFLINPCDSKRISDKILILRESPELRKQLGQEAINTIQARYDLHAWCQAIQKEYDLILTNR